MTPTNELRFVVRRTAHMDGTNTVYKAVRILQQKWAGPRWSDKHGYDIDDCEWRDVPVEKEA